VSAGLTRARADDAMPAASRRVTGAPQTLADVVHLRAAINGDQIAYTFLADGSTGERSITWAQLDHRAGKLGAHLRGLGAAGQRVLLALPSGIAFIEAIFACWYAGAIIVPISLPRHRRVKHRLHRIVSDAGAKFALGVPDTRDLLEGEGAEAPAVGLAWVDALTPVDRSATVCVAPAAPGAAGADVALLQYTSGSTGTPRGVMVTHANLMCNSALIAEACGHAPGQTIAGWLPLYHDMGLIGLVLQAAFAGTRCILMPPERFLMRPWLWLQMISDYRVYSSPAPNFAYDLCVEKVTEEHKRTIDLSGWRNALNGSEPVRATTINRFTDTFASCGFGRETFFPCYGLAEATLFVSGPGPSRVSSRRTADGILLSPSDGYGHVGCGGAFGDTQLAIVNPQTAELSAPGRIGEIWLAGESCARGYWNNPDATAPTFNACLKTSDQEQGDGRKWLRTGDLGFIADGELFITGRLRELIIIAGRNHFPVDLEQTAESADPVVATSSTAAFSVEIDGSERLVIVAEVRREFARPARGETRPALDAEAIAHRLLAAVVAGHQVAPHEIVLLRPGALPRTTSGKIRRHDARDQYLGQTLERLELTPYAANASL